MKKFLTLLFLLLLISSSSFSQVFDGTWSCLWATYDNDVNGPGNSVVSVAVVSEDALVALVNRPARNIYHLVGYRGADSANGRLGQYIYGSAAQDTRQLWINGFDQVYMEDPNDVAATANGYLYVANNDEFGNILVFELKQDTVDTVPFRLQTGSKYLWSIDVDQDGKVYITKYDEVANQSSVLIYDNTTNEPAWTNTFGVTPTILQEIILPDAGEARGLAVSDDGNTVYVSNYQAKKVYKYDGNTTSGYTIDPAFNYTLNDTVFAQVLASDTLYPGPWGLGLMPDNNLLFLASDVDFLTGGGYEYGRVYILHPFTGEVLDTIDVAEWTYITCDSSYYRNSGELPTNASGYTSVYNVDFDENNNLYTQSYFGWTVDKWAYSGTLPSVTSLKRHSELAPDGFSLMQNYPNPFNPSTTIKFSIANESIVSLVVYSITGEKVIDLIQPVNYDKGTYELSFNASRLASGSYIYTLKAGDQSISKKLTLIK